MSASLAQRRDVLGEGGEIGAVGPGHDDRRHARAGSSAGSRAGSCAPAPDRRCGRATTAMPAAVLARLVVGRPIDRAALDEADAQPAALDDRRRARRGEVGAGAGMGDAEPVEPRDRAEDRGAAVIDVVGEPDRGDAADLQRLAGDRRGRRRTPPARPYARRAARRGSIRDWRRRGRRRATPRRSGRTAPPDRRHSSGSRRRPGSSRASGFLLETSSRHEPAVPAIYVESRDDEWVIATTLWDAVERCQKGRTK